MALKDILIHMDAAAHCEARLETAVNLAQAHGAHLIGLYIITRPRIPSFVELEVGSEVLERQMAAQRETAEDVRARFDKQVARAGIVGEWRVVEGEPVEILALHARYCDVVVVSQRDPDGVVPIVDEEMPDRLILSAGRPVLVVPYVGSYPVIGRRVMVAWDASRLAARAVNDALPVLRAADKVTIMAVNPKDADAGHGDIPGADIALHLARHGVEAVAQHTVSDEVDIADMLLSRGADDGTDLFVMGAYGHPRWRELVLGGVTRDMLGHATQPVMMSH